MSAKQAEFILRCTVTQLRIVTFLFLTTHLISKEHTWIIFEFQNVRLALFFVYVFVVFKKKRDPK